MGNEGLKSLLARRARASKNGERTNRWPNFRVKDSYSHAIYHLQFEPASLGKGQRSAAVRNPLSFYTFAILDAEETGLISRDLLTFSPGKKVAELMIV